MKNLFICVDNENRDSPCYVNILDICYIIHSEEGFNAGKTSICLRGSNNIITTVLSTKEVMRRIEIAFNGSVPKEVVERFDLIDMDE